MKTNKILISKNIKIETINKTEKIIINEIFEKFNNNKLKIQREIKGIVAKALLILVFLFYNQNLSLMTKYFSC